MAYLITTANVAIRQGAGHELVEHNPIGVDIRLEAVGVWVLHTDHFSSLHRPDQAGKPGRSANGWPIVPDPTNQTGYNSEPPT